MANHEHISGSFADELEGVKNKLLEMGGLAEQQIKMAIEALNNDDKSASKAVISRDQLVNEFEVNILIHDPVCNTEEAYNEYKRNTARLIPYIY